MPGLSPRTQGFMQPPPSPEDAIRAFEEGFTQMANGVLSGKFPELMDSVQTFKVLDTDLDSGSGVGAFVLSLNGTALYIPVVLASNRIKPMEIVFYKDKNIFLPLDKEWLDEISRNSLDELGEGVEPPEELEPDQDIRDVVIPPTVGRHVYASFPVPGEKLAEFLTNAPNRVKKAFRIVLEKRPAVLKYAFENFDRKMLVDALRPHIEKTAAAPALAVVLTPDDSADRFKQVFGKFAAAAWKQAIKVGFATADLRGGDVNVAIETEEPIRLTTTQESGFYEVPFQDGTSKKCLVVSEPQPLVSKLYAGKRTDMRYGPSEYWKTHRRNEKSLLVDQYGRPDEPPHHQEPQRFLVYTEDGKVIVTTHTPVGKWIPAEEMTGPLAKLGTESQNLGNGYGFFVCLRGGKFRATEPLDILSVTTGSDGVRRVKCSSGRVLVTDPKSPITELVAPSEGNVTYLPPNYKFVRGEHGTDALLQGADDTLRYVDALEKEGALKVKLVDAGASMFSIGGLEPMSKVATIETLMQDLGLRDVEAVNLVEKTAARGRHSFYLVNPEQFLRFEAWVKTAQGPAPMAPPPEMAGGMPPEMAGGMPPEMAGGMPPEMAGGMPPEAMMPPEPPPPSPVEQAAAEVEADLAQQSAQVSQQIAEQQRDLANQLSAIAAVKERANQIAMEQAGGPPAGAPGGVPQEPPPGVGPEAGGMPPLSGMPPEAMGGAMPPPGGMPPEAMGGTMPPPGAMPTESPMAAEQMASEAGPMMEEAAALQDPEAFEATAIGSMATDADLRGEVANYLPNLEKALDNLGRILLTLWMRESELRAELGEADFNDLEKRLQSVFTNMGALVLRINQTAMAAPEEDEGDEEA